MVSSGTPGSSGVSPASSSDASGQWLPACESRDLRRKPLAARLGGHPIVLFRDGDGHPRALRDVCPHRGVPLSLGSCAGGRVVCSYHGWEFDGEGVCRVIPSDPEPTPPRPMATAYEARERDGCVEVRIPDLQAAEPRPGKRRPRWATQADSGALVDLVRACPMKGSVEMFFDRAPDFFTLCRLQGDGARVAVIDDKVPGRIAAAGAIASFPQVYVQGQIRQAAYACDLRVHPGARSGLLVKRVYDFMTAWSLEQGWDLGFTAIMKDNEAMAAVLAGKGGVVPYRHFATMRNFTVQFLLRKRPPRGITVRPATAADIPDMVALWNRLQQHKQFAPVWTEESFAERLSSHPGLAIDRYFLAFRGDRLTGLLATWNQEAFKRMVVLGYSAAMLKMRRWYNPLARALRLAPIPAVGRAMPYFYATHLCAETAADLEALYVHIYNLHKNPGTLFFSTMLDVRDPLLPALDRFMTQHVDIELYIMDPQGRYEAEAFGARPCYFDPAIV